MPWIEHPPEPRELLLVWQAPSDVPDRSRWAVGRLFESDGRIAFEYLHGDRFRALNLNRPESELNAAGFSGYPAFDYGKKPDFVFREHVLETFLRRLPPAKRSDFPEYRAHFALDEGARVSPLTLLAVTEARLPSDGFSLVDPLDPALSFADVTFEIAGLRHLLPKGQIGQQGCRLLLQADPSNAWDPHAVKVFASQELIGFVNRLQAPTIGYWLSKRELLCWLLRVNGRPDSPRAYALLQVRPATAAAAE